MDEDNPIIFHYEVPPYGAGNPRDELLYEAISCLDEEYADDNIKEIYLEYIKRFFHWNILRKAGQKIVIIPNMYGISGATKCVYEDDVGKIFALVRVDNA